MDTANQERTATREAWLAKRREGIGASEAPVVLGLRPSRMALYLDKRGLLPPVEPTPAMRRGLKLEPYIAAEYGEITGDPVVETQRHVRHPAMPWVMATLDGLTVSGRIVEFKSVGPFGAVRTIDGPDDLAALPDSWVVQAHQQMLAADTTEVMFAVLMPDHDVYPVGPLRRNEDLIAIVSERVTAFWHEFVLAGIPPEEVTPEDAEHVARAFRRQTGEILEGGPDVAGWAEQYTELGRSIKALEDQRKQLKGEILLAVKDAAGIDAPGWEVRRSVVDVREHVVKASTRVRLSVKEAMG